MSNSRPYDFDRVVRIVFVALCVGAGLYMVNLLSDVLLPFLVGCLLAFMLEPIVGLNKRFFRLKGRTVATVLTMLEVIIVLGLAIELLAPYIYNEISEMVAILTQYTEKQMQLPYLPVEVQKFVRNYIDISYISGMLTKDQWINLITQTASKTWDFMGATASMVFTFASWLIVVLYMVFVMVDYDNLRDGFKKTIPDKYRHETVAILNDVIHNMELYFRGQTLIAFLVGVLFSIGFVIIGLPLAVVFGMFIGLLNMVPYLQLISIPICAVLCLFGSVSSSSSFWELFGWAIVVYCVVQTIQDLFLTPKIMGKILGLKPAIILLSLSIWGTLLGFIGLIIALPLTTLIISYYKQYILKVNSAKVEEKDETPASQIQN